MFFMQAMVSSYILNCHLIKWTITVSSINIAKHAHIQNNFMNKFILITHML